MSRAAKGARCKRAGFGLRWFESILTHQFSFLRCPRGHQAGLARGGALLRDAPQTFRRDSSAVEQRLCKSMVVGSNLSRHQDNSLVGHTPDRDAGKSDQECPPAAAVAKAQPYRRSRELAAGSWSLSVVKVRSRGESRHRLRIQPSPSLCTFETCRPVPPMSVHRGRPEVIGASSNRRV